jgi:hypothetical protein
MNMSEKPESELSAKDQEFIRKKLQDKQYLLDRMIKPIPKEKR